MVTDWIGSVPVLIGDQQLCIRQNTIEQMHQLRQVLHYVN